MGVWRFHGMVIAMYFDDHGFPHFHARHAGASAKIRVDNVCGVTLFGPKRTIVSRFGPKTATAGLTASR